jgi:type 1 glutamine amidotransferase
VVKGRQVLAVLGGSWHDFSGFAEWLRPTITQAGHHLRVSHELGELGLLEANGVDAVVLYTCLDEKSGLAHIDAEVDGLCRWVGAGGGLLALHSATVSARQEPRLRALIGGAFVEHPPRCEICVSRAGAPHPMTVGVDSFRVQDELYLHECDPAIDVRLVASAGGGPHPMAWTRSERRGKVAYLGLGHDAAAWSHPLYERLVLQSLAWVLADPPAGLPPR